MTRATLLAVCGCTPQVITETLYALHMQKRPVHAVRVLTTAPGKAACNAGLFDPETGAYAAFLRDFGLTGEEIDFAPSRVRCVTDPHGRALEDISGEEENELFLRACMEAAFAATQDPNSVVYFSIAGGRKTMGACLALAAQFYARRQDRIFHVLCSPEFENCPDFYYPPPHSRPVTLRDSLGQPYIKQSRYARVTLVHMPFVSVRERLDAGMLQAPENPAALLTSLVREERPRLVADLRERKVSWKGIELDVPPALLALYAFFVQVKKECGCGRERCTGCRECWVSLHELFERQAELTGLYERRIQAERTYEHMSDTGIISLSQQNFNTYRSKLNKCLEQAFGPYDAPDLCITPHGPHGDKRYGIPLDRGRLEIRW